MSDDKYIPFLIGASLILLIGMLIGGAISEMEADMISLDVLDEVCKELYGVNFKYEEANGRAFEFKCVATVESIKIKTERGVQECSVNIAMK